MEHGVEKVKCFASARNGFLRSGPHFSGTICSNTDYRLLRGRNEPLQIDRITSVKII